MNKLMKIFLLVALLASVNVALAKNNTTYYNIRRAWIWNDVIYLLYERQIIKSKYSLKDIHGTILSERNSAFLMKFSSKSVLDGMKINLADGIESENLVYADEDFEIRSTGAVASMARRNFRSTFLCDLHIWGNSNPVRNRDKIFYCGKFLSLNGNGLVDLSTDVSEAIVQRSNATVHRKNVDRLVTSNSIFNNELQISLFDDGNRLKSQLEIIRVGFDDQKFLDVHALPFDSHDFLVVNTYSKYFSEGQLVESRGRLGENQNFTYICHVDSCDKINKIASSFVVDDRHGSLVIFESKFVGAPTLTVRLRSIGLTD